MMVSWSKVDYRSPRPLRESGFGGATTYREDLSEPGPWAICEHLTWPEFASRGRKPRFRGFRASSFWVPRKQSTPWSLLPPQVLSILHEKSRTSAVETFNGSGPQIMASDWNGVNAGTWWGRRIKKWREKQGKKGACRIDTDEAWAYWRDTERREEDRYSWEASGVWLISMETMMMMRTICIFFTGSDRQKTEWSAETETGLTWRNRRERNGASACNCWKAQPLKFSMDFQYVPVII